MGRFLCEAHLHTSEGSACANISGAQQAIRYKNHGYSTMFVTDHFLNGNTAVDRSLPWKEKMESFCKGYENAKAKGDKIGLNVLFGLEYSYNGADFITLGIDKAWLISHPELMDINVFDYIKLVHEAGGFIIHAHPFRRAEYIREIHLLPDYTDAVEVDNSGNHDPKTNEQAAWYAKNFDLPVTGGTDNHYYPRGEFCAVVTDYEIKTVQDYINAVKNREVTLERILFKDEKYK